MASDSAGDEVVADKQPRREPVCVWVTGLACAGKTTLATALEQRLRQSGNPVRLLDGDLLRRGLRSDLGFTEADRTENMRRIVEMSTLMTAAGLIVIVASVSPFRSQRLARAQFPADEVIEVFVDTPREECERRDTKGIYAMARSETLTDFTGVDGRYDPPTELYVRVDTSVMSVEESVDRILHFMDRRYSRPCR